MSKVERQIDDVRERFDSRVDRIRERARRAIAKLRRDEKAKIEAIREGATKVSDDGLAFIASWEGFRPCPYLDVAGIPTIGYGHTAGVSMSDRCISREDALGLLRADASWAQRAVDELVRVRLSQPQFDALVSFTFNCGAGALRDSSLLDLLNAGRYGRVPDELMRWVMAGGVRVEGLVNRRKAECRLWQRG
jgi:lysozyme